MSTNLRIELEQKLRTREELLAKARDNFESLERSCNHIRNTLDFISNEEADWQESRGDE